MTKEHFLVKNLQFHRSISRKLKFRQKMSHLFVVYPIFINFGISLSILERVIWIMTLTMCLCWWRWNINISCIWWMLSINLKTRTKHLWYQSDCHWNYNWRSVPKNPPFKVVLFSIEIIFNIYSHLFILTWQNRKWISKTELQN